MGTPLRVDRWSGFGVNRVGVPGRHSTGWPLAFSLSHAEDVSVVSAVSARAEAIADLLVRDANPHLVVFDAGYHVYDDDSAQVPLTRIAADAGVTARAHDDVLVLARDDLRPLLRDLPLYDLVVVDTVDPESYEEVVLTAWTADPSAAPVLRALPGSRLLYDGHDDHYVYLETRSPSLPGALLARLLGLFAGAAILGEREAVLVSEPPPALAESLLAVSPEWCGWPRALRESSLELALHDTGWRLGEAFPDTPAWTVTYDVVTKEWGEPFPPS